MSIDFIRGLSRLLDLIAQGVRLRFDPRDQPVMEMKGYVDDPGMTRYPRADGYCLERQPSGFDCSTIRLSVGLGLIVQSSTSSLSIFNERFEVLRTASLTFAQLIPSSQEEVISCNSGQSLPGPVFAKSGFTFHRNDFLDSFGSKEPVGVVSGYLGNSFTLTVKHGQLDGKDPRGEAVE